MSYRHGRHFTDNNYYFEGWRRNGTYIDPYEYNHSYDRGRDWGGRYGGQQRAWSDYDNRGYRHGWHDSYNDMQYGGRDRRRELAVKREWARKHLPPDSADEEEDDRDWEEDWRRKDEQRQNKENTRKTVNRESVRRREYFDRPYSGENWRERRPPTGESDHGYDRYDSENKPPSRDTRHDRPPPRSRERSGRYGYHPRTQDRIFRDDLSQPSRATVARYGNPSPPDNSDRKRGNRPATKDKSKHDRTQDPTKDRSGVLGIDAPSRNEPVYEDHRYGRDRHRFFYERVFVVIQHGYVECSVP